MPIRFCLTCGQEIVVPSHEIKRGGGKYCSKSCRAKQSKTLFKKGHKPFKVKGAENGRWNEGSSLLPYTTDWIDDLKESIRKRDEYTCKICGIHQDELDSGRMKKLHVHHIDYNKENSNPNNLVALCPSCHMKTNGNRDYWIEYFK